METILYTDNAKVKIGAGPAVVIGEKINPTGRKKLAAALQERQPRLRGRAGHDPGGLGRRRAGRQRGRARPGRGGPAAGGRQAGRLRGEDADLHRHAQSGRAGGGAGGGARQAAGQLGQRRGEIAAAASCRWSRIAARP